jgi:hypothetical protein
MHIEHLSSKLNSGCYLIRSLRSVISKNTWEQFIFLMYIRSWCMA